MSIMKRWPSCRARVWDPPFLHRTASSSLIAPKMNLHNFYFGKEKRQEESNRRGSWEWVKVSVMRPLLILDSRIPSDLYSQWVLERLLCQAIHVSGSWVFVCSPLLLPLFFSFSGVLFLFSSFLPFPFLSFFFYFFFFFNKIAHCIPLGLSLEVLWAS